VVSLSEEFCMIDGHPFDRQRVTSALRDLLADDSLGEVWVVSGDDGLEGYAVITWGYSLESGGRDALLDEMYVSKPGSGTGSTLIEAVIAAIRERGLTRIFLETEMANAAARRFYGRHGFEVEDSVWMSLEL
jgi:GNAT superfamily N-acetyltransferase